MAHRIQRGAILVICMGEQLHRLDIGDRVDDLPGDHRARRRAPLGASTDMRQKQPDKPDIKRKPNRQHHHPPQINRRQDREGPDDRREREDCRVVDLGDRVCDRPRRLHLLLRNPPGKVIVEIGDRLPHRPAMQPREDLRQQCRRHQKVRRRGGQPERQGPQHDVKQQNPYQ